MSDPNQRIQQIGTINLGTWGRGRLPKELRKRLPKGWTYTLLALPATRFDPNAPEAGLLRRNTHE